MKTFVLIYEGFVQFEIVLACYLMKIKGDIITLGLEQKLVSSIEGFQTLPNCTIETFRADEADLFLIPGGDPNILFKNKNLYQILNMLNDKSKVIAAICSGPLHLAAAGILKNKKYTTTLPLDDFKDFDKEFFIDTNVVTDNNIITAKASGYVDFAIEIGKKLNIYDDQEDLDETIRYFKYFDNP